MIGAKVDILVDIWITNGLFRGVEKDPFGNLVQSITYSLRGTHVH